MTDVTWADDGNDAAVTARVAAAVARPGPVTLCLPGGDDAPTGVRRARGTAPAVGQG